MADENKLAEMIGEVGKSLADVKERVQNMGADFTEKMKATGEVSQSAKDNVDKALTEMGTIATRLSDLEKRAAREKDNEGAAMPMSIGERVVSSDAFKASDLSGGGRGSVRVRMERSDITSANTTTGAGRSAGTSLVPGQRVPGIIAPPDRTLTIRDLLAPGTTASSSIEYVQETGYDNKAAVVPETTPKPYSNITFDLKTANVRTLAHLFKASRQILDDAPGLQSYIDARAEYGLRYVEELQLLKGDGQGSNINGLIPQAQDFAAKFVPANATEIDTLRLALLQVTLAEYPASGYVLHPTDWAKIEMTKDAEGRYIVGNPINVLGPRLWGLPVVATQAMSVGRFLTGAFALAAQIFDRMDIEILLSTENDKDFENNMVTLRAEERLALAVYRPEAFVEGAIAPVTA